MLDVQYAPSNAVLNWAQGVIDAHPGMPTIINTHDYMAYGNRRSSVGNTIFNGPITGSNANPDGLVYGNPQVFMVICGHNHYSWNQISTDKAGKPVIEVLADYQDLRSGDGYMRLYQFDEPNSVIHVKTYSPYDTTTPYLTGRLNQFDIPLDFNGRLARRPDRSTPLLAAAGMATLLCGIAARQSRSLLAADKRKDLGGPGSDA